MLLLMLFWAAIGMTMLTLTVEVYSESVVRDRKTELLRIGEEFRRGIGSYFFGSPGTVMNLPVRLEDLESDPRMLVITRHVRRIYRDPMTGESKWGVIRLRDVAGWSPPAVLPGMESRTYAADPEGIVGIYSLGWPPDGSTNANADQRIGRGLDEGGPVFAFGIGAPTREPR
ncbi:MAG: hypothetical protein M9951_10330 [Burkholderiaceae bacterium]|nr:hypothetical protein [Burkholderiaceae bacterium]